MENSEKCCTPLSTNLSPSSCLAEVGNGKDHISFDAAAWAKSSSRNKRKTREKWLQSGKKPARKNWDLSVLSDKVGWSVFHPPSHSHHHHYYPHFTPDTFAVELQRTVRKLSTVIERCRRSWRSFASSSLKTVCILLAASLRTLLFLTGVRNAFNSTETKSFSLYQKASAHLSLKKKRRIIHRSTTNCIWAAF